jgi:hypothetical protein
LRGVEIHADVILKGVAFMIQILKNADATKFDFISLTT